MRCLQHVVAISFKLDASEAERQKAWGMYQILGDECGGRGAGILYWKVDWNLDQRKGYHLVESVIFTDWDALQAFRAHPNHQGVFDLMRRIADWVVADLEVDFPFEL